METMDAVNSDTSAQSRFAVVMGVSRLPFLTLTPACVLLGVAMAFWQTGRFDGGVFAVMLFSALMAHVSVNAFNEYFDFRSGLDLATTRTPFSGGSGTLPNNPSLLKVALVTAWVSFLAVAASGMWLIYASGWGLLPLGLIGLSLIYFYTQTINRFPLLCLFSPGIGFGLVMTLGSYYAMTGGFSHEALVLSLVPLLLVSNVLLLNQFPDLEADRGVGRRHLPIVLGLKASSRVFVAQLLIALVLIAVMVLLGALPLAVLISGLVLLLAPRLIKGVLGHYDDAVALIPLLGMNVAVAHMVPLLLAIALFVDAYWF